MDVLDRVIGPITKQKDLIRETVPQLQSSGGSNPKVQNYFLTVVLNLLEMPESTHAIRLSEWQVIVGPSFMVTDQYLVLVWADLHLF